MAATTSTGEVYTTLREIWKALLQHHRGKLAGTGVGLLFGFAVMLVGPLWALFISFCAGVGYIVGRRFDEDEEGLAEAIEELLVRPWKR